jgi:2-iminobutanoate/2-iminopropanoate deaminase
MKKAIFISGAPRPIAPYSQAILVDQTLYVAGQIAIDPFTGEFITGGPAAQTRQIMKNIGAILKEAGMDFPNVVKVSIFLSDMSSYAEVNEVYGTYFSADPPAREAMAASGLPKNADVEISCIAVISSPKEILSMH